MKKKLLNILMTLGLILMPLTSLSAATFKPATLYKGYDRVAVYSEKEADYFFGLNYRLEENKLGIAIPTGVANFETSLLVPLSSTATSSMTLVSGTTDDGNTLNGLYGFVIDNGGSNQEYILATCVNTACSSLTRGISVETGNTSIAGLKKDHRRGAIVQITDHPLLITLARILNGQESTPGGITFGTSSITLGSNGVITGLDTPISSATTSAANINYVNLTSLAGAPSGNETSAGTWIGATQAKMAAGTATSTYNGLVYSNVLLSKYSSSTSPSTTTVVVTNTSGKIDTSFVDQAASYSWTGDWAGLPLYFGDGSDGDVTISSNTTSTRDMYYNNLTIASSSTLYPNGYRIFVRNTLTVNSSSSIARIGNNASGQTGGTGLTTGTIFGGLAGVNGQNAGGYSSTPGNTANPSLTGLNGADGGKNYNNNAGGTGGVATLEKSEMLVTSITATTLTVENNLKAVWLPFGDSSHEVLSGSGGGGAGSAVPDRYGGGSGGNGGTVYIAARTIINNGIISVAGGNGGAGGTPSANYGSGGGAGGSGGLIFLFYRTLTTEGTLNMSGGTGGAPGTGGTGTGTIGGTGPAGKYIKVKLN